jgi:hypothetical protein
MRETILTVTRGPHAGFIACGEDTYDALRVLRETYPGDTAEIDRWEVRPVVNGRITAIHYVMGPLWEEPDPEMAHEYELRCGYCRRDIQGEDAEYIYATEHKGGGCLDSEDYLQEVIANQGRV